jgi:hypothetical protein
MTSLSVRVRPVKPVRDTARRLRGEPATALSVGLPAGLMIRKEGEKPDSPGTAYRVTADRDEGTVFGYRLEKLDGEGVYDIDAGFSSCTCPDHVYRQRACKHLRGLRAALLSVGLI